MNIASCQMPKVKCNNFIWYTFCFGVVSCQLSDAKSKVQQFHLLSFVLVSSIVSCHNQSAKGSFSFVLVMFIVMNIASCQMPKSKLQQFYLFWPVGSCQIWSVQQYFGQMPIIS